MLDRRRLQYGHRVAIQYLRKEKKRYSPAWLEVYAHYYRQTAASSRYFHLVVVIA